MMIEKHAPFKIGHHYLSNFSVFNVVEPHCIVGLDVASTMVSKA